MKTKKLTFTHEELTDIRRALFIRWMDIDEDKYPCTAKATLELYNKVRDYLDAQ